MDRQQRDRAGRRAYAGVRTAILGLIVSVSACGEQPVPTVALHADAAQSVIGDALQNLDDAGRFRFDGSQVASDEITEARAKEIAAAYWEDAQRFVLSTAVADRGGMIHATALTPCDRAFYARAAYDDVSSMAPAVVQKVAGSHWLVGLCYQDIEEVVVAVSAQATDVVLSRATTRQPARLLDPGSSNFFSMGVPVGARIPVEPEVAARAAATASGRHVRAVPQLLMRERPHSPLLAVWRIELDAPVPAAANGGKALEPVSTVFVGPMNGWQRPAIAAARAGNNAQVRTADEITVESRRAGRSVTALSRRADAPPQMELIAFGGR